MTLAALFCNILLLSHAIAGPVDTLKMNEDVPQIVFPGVAQSDFQEAFNVMDACVVREPGYGFSYPFIAPGGHYGGCWWQLDASISLQAAKWINQRFSENMLRGFVSVQRGDGRIPLYGHDEVPGFPTCSSLPKLFQAAYAVLKRSEDTTLLQTVYPMLSRYMDWWLSDARRDAATGLITGVFEESFPPVESRLKATAQVDLNVEVAGACQYMATLADRLGLPHDRRRHLDNRQQLVNAINTYMWNERFGAYFSYDVVNRRQDTTLIVYAFDPLYSKIAPSSRADRMVRLLTDDAYFNWDTRPLTSAAKTSAIYHETTGPYNGAPAWSGSIWSLRNEVIVRGLADAGRYDHAAYLALQTVRQFNNNYFEFLKPSDGSGQGVERYAWSAAQYIQLLIENIFGIDYDRFTGEIRITPNLCQSLKGEKMALRHIPLPDGGDLDVEIDWEGSSASIRYAIRGGTSRMDVRVGWPTAYGTKVTVTDGTGRRLRTFKNRVGNTVIHEIDNAKKSADHLTFIFR